MSFCDYCGEECKPWSKFRLSLRQIVDENYIDSWPVVYFEDHKFCSRRCSVHFYRDAFLSGGSIEKAIH